ncbi:MAG: hypothetical protein ACYC77_07230 [Coriobacteriia bacterium]
MSILRTFLLVAALTIPMGAQPTATPASASLASTGTAAGDAAAIDLASDAALAQATLAGLAARYDLLDGVTVTIGHTPADTQAVAYYTEGRIVIDPAHHVSIGEILEHEIWHIIDWRDNAKMDWGEDLPPATSAAYLVR